MHFFNKWNMYRHIKTREYEGQRFHLPACERRRASDCAQSTNSFVLPSTNGSRRFFKKVVSFSSLSFCDACTLEAGKDFTPRTSSSNSIIPRISVQEEYLQLVMNFLPPYFRRKVWVFLRLNSCHGSQCKLANIVVKEFTPEKHSKYRCWVQHWVPSKRNSKPNAIILLRICFSITLEPKRFNEQKRGAWRNWSMILAPNIIKQMTKKLLATFNTYCCTPAFPYLSYASRFSASLRTW